PVSSIPLSKPRRAVEQTRWQAVPAMWFVERSGVGLNALLGRCASFDMLKTNAKQADDKQNTVLGAVATKTNDKPTSLRVNQSDTHGVDARINQRQREHKLA